MSYCHADNEGSPLRRLLLPFNEVRGTLQHDDMRAQLNTEPRALMTATYDAFSRLLKLRHSTACPASRREDEHAKQ